MKLAGAEGVGQGGFKGGGADSDRGRRLMIRAMAICRLRD